MLRKLISAASVLAVSIIGLSQANPAQAWPDYTTDVSTVSNTDSAWGVTTLGKTLNSDMVYLYQGNDGDQLSNRFLKTMTVGSNGNLQGPFTVAADNTGAYFLLPDGRSSWIDANGTFNLVYGIFKDNGLKTVLNWTTSSDGRAWSAPQVIETLSIPEASACAADPYNNCGIRDFALAVNAAGTVALEYVVGQSDASNKIIFRTKTFGKPWSAPTVTNSTTSSVVFLHLVSTGKGWLTSYLYANDSSSRSLYSAFSKDDKGSSWTAPQLRVTGECVWPQRFVQIAPQKFSMLFTEGCDRPNKALKSQSFDATNSRFGNTQVIHATSGDITWINATDYVSGQSAIGFTDYINFDGVPASAKYVVYKNGVASAVQSVNESASEGSVGVQAISSMSMDLLGHLTIVWGSNRTLSDRTHVSSFYRGNRSDTEINFQNGNMYAYSGFSNDGDVYLIQMKNNSVDARVRIRSDAPDLNSSVKISGNAKRNAALTAKLPLVTPNAIGQRWNFTQQWYSCQYQVTEVLAIATENCTQIAGATAITYKVKPADKGKFLQVRVNVKSDNAMQVQYSASTLAVK